MAELILIYRSSTEKKKRSVNFSWYNDSISIFHDTRRVFGLLLVGHVEQSKNFLPTVIYICRYVRDILRETYPFIAFWKVLGHFKFVHVF
jgi:hypothetical protein